MAKRAGRGTRPKRTSVDHRPLFTLWLDRDVIAFYQRGGRGWQSRINAVLRKVAKLPAVKQKKA